MKVFRVMGIWVLLLTLLCPSAYPAAKELQLYHDYNDSGKLIRQYTGYIDYYNTGGLLYHGTVITWDDDGRIVEQATYEDGIRNGSFTKWGYDTQGRQFIEQSGAYENHYDKQGEWYGTSPITGGISYIDVYKNNKLVKSKSWNLSSDGILYSIVTGELYEDGWDWEYTFYYPNGNLRSRVLKKHDSPYWNYASWYGDTDEPTGRFQEGLLMDYTYASFYYKWMSGLWTEYSLDGKLYSAIEYQDGAMHGKAVYYGADGYVLAEIPYTYHARNGNVKVYYPGGALKYSWQYLNDVQEGKQEEYFSDGKLMKHYTMKNGELHGRYEQWQANGNLFEVSDYADGKKDGRSQQYDENGILRSDYVYLNDKMHGPFTIYDADGKITSQGTMKAGNYDGTVTRYRGDGGIDCIIPYKDGILHGAYISYIDTRFLDPPPAGSTYIWEQGALCNGNRCGSWVSGVLESIHKDNDPNGPIVDWKHVISIIDHGSVTYSTTTTNPYPALQQDKEIRGRVIRVDTKKPIVGVTAKIGDSSVLTDSSGYYSIKRPPLDTYDISFTKEGFSGHSESVDMKDRSYRTFNALLAPKSASLPAVTKVESQYGNFFLKNVPIPNTYKAFVNWSGTSPGTVHFRVNGIDNPVTGNADGAEKVFNVDTDLIASFNPKGNIVRITAENMNGISPGIFTLNPIVVPLPDWSLGLGTFTFEVKNNVPAYGLEKKWPAEQPLAFQISEETLGNILWGAWGFFPLIGGKEFGIPPTQVGLEVKVKTDGSGSVSASGKMGFAVAGSTIENTLKGTGDVMYQADKGLLWAGASVETELKGIVEREVGPVELIPALAGATQLGWGMGSVFQWFNKTAKIKAAINVGTNLKLGVVNKDGKISFSPFEDVLQSGIDLGLAMELMGVKATVSGGGAAKLYWQVPANPDYLKSAQVELNAKLEVAWKAFKETFEQSHTLATTSSPASSDGSSAGGTGFQPISRDFLRLAPYNQFVVPSIRTGTRVPLSNGTLQATDSTIVTNIYPYAEPAIAAQGDKIAIAYVYNDPGDLELRATEIYVTYFDGSQFSTPVPILDDTRAEFAPTLAFDSNGKVVCAWERVKDEAFTGTGDGIADMAAMAQEMEIVYAAYDPASGTWSAPSALTVNNYLDFKPILMRGADGSLLLVWQSNTGNLTTGTASYPTRIHSALWNPATLTFGTPLQSSEEFVNAFGFWPAYLGPNGLLAFIKDSDGDFSTITDQEIHMALFDGTAWAASTAVTADTLQDSNPRVVYTSAGNSELVWRKGDSLVRLTDWSSKTYETIRSGCQNITFSDFRLLRDPQDRLVLVWQDIVDEKIDMFYRVYDSAKISWSKDIRLTNDAPLEKDFQGLFSPDGVLHLTYLRQDRETNINDLHYLTYELKADLTVAGRNMAIDPQSPIPGNTAIVSCKVDNVGDTAFSNVAVDFYLGNPDSGGQLIGRGFVSPVVLQAGASGSASVAWTVPAEPGSAALYAVVDPDNGASEADETNNRASFYPFLPDLVALQCLPQDMGDGSVDVTAVVKNSGTATATAVNVLFKVNGSPIGVTSLPQIRPGETADISRLIWAGTDYSGEEPKIEVILDPDNLISECAKDNNRAFALLQTAPRFVAGPETAVFERLQPGAESVPQTILLTNLGGKDLSVKGIVLSDTTNFTLLVDGGHAPLGGLTGTIPAGQSRTVSVSFKPSAIGDFSATMTITTDDPEVPDLVLHLGLQASPAVPRPVIAVAPTIHDFGSVAAGAESPVHIVQITNTGNADLTVTSVTLSDTEHFLLDLDAGDSRVSNLPVLIPAAQSRTFGIRLSTALAEVRLADITIASNDPDHPTMRLTVRGTVLGEPRPALRLTPSSYYFGPVEVGSSSEPFGISIVNTGEAPLPISSVVLTDPVNFSLSLDGGVNPLGELPTSIPAGQFRTVTVLFRPTSPQSYSAALTIGSSDPGIAPQWAVLLGNDPPFPGDVDGDRMLTLTDAVLALQVAGSAAPLGAEVTQTADVNDDGKIGIVEAIYILQRLGELR